MQWNIQSIYWVKTGPLAHRLRAKINGKTYWCGQYVTKHVFIKAIHACGILILSDNLKNEVIIENIKTKGT